MIVKLTDKDVDRILSESKTIVDFIVNIHKEIVTPKIFDSLRDLGDFVYCNQNTGKNIGKKVINQYGLNAAMTWMNYGFSTRNSNHLNDFEFDITSIMEHYNNRKESDHEEMLDHRA